jgi:hypothetical protein
MKILQKFLPLVLFTAAAFNAQADDQKPWRDSSIVKDVQQTCDKSESLQFPSNDIPTATELTSLKDCASSYYYYGINVPVNYTIARKVLLRNRQIKMAL